MSIPGICDVFSTGLYLTKEVQSKLMKTPVFYFRGREKAVTHAFLVFLYAKKKSHIFKIFFCDSVLQKLNWSLLLLMNLAVLEDWTIQKFTVLWCTQAMLTWTQTTSTFQKTLGEEITGSTAKLSWDLINVLMYSVLYHLFATCPYCTQQLMEWHRTQPGTLPSCAPTLCKTVPDPQREVELLVE